MYQREDAYFDLSKRERDTAIRYFLDALVQSDEVLPELRRKRGLPDEDVKVYLAHLLFAFSTPRYRELVRKYLGHYESDIVRLIEGTDNRYVRYFIYKINADDLLLRIGVFQNVGGRTAIPLLEKRETYYQEKGRSYYEMAADHHRRIFRKRTAVGEVLEKLATYFTAYCVLLHRVRRHFFDFVTGGEAGFFSDFVQKMQGYEKKLLLEEKQNQFLDLYLKWLQDSSKHGALKEKINSLCREIEELDPTFQFRIEG